jgi:hypothetical protein
MWWLAGCAEPLLVGSFMGTLDQESVQVAAALDPAQITVYFAGSGESQLTDTHWFEAPRGEADTFTAEADGWVLDGEIEDERVFGRITDANDVWIPFTTTRAPESVTGTIDGLWAPDEAPGACPVGVVLFNTGFQVQGGYCPTEGVMVELESVELTPEDGVILVRALVPEAPVEFEAKPVFPGP